jgi:hypothetical protein
MFIIHSHVLNEVGRCNSWVDNNRCLDHFPILLGFEVLSDKPSAPFKFQFHLGSWRKSFKY